MSGYPWYKEVAAAEPLTQGDIIEQCPVLAVDERVWDEAADAGSLMDALDAAAGVNQLRAIVMTQACDLQHAKVRNVVLCPADSVVEYRAIWAWEYRANNGHEPSEKSWLKHLKDIGDGRIWHKALLQNKPGSSETVLPHLVVEFHEVFSVPRHFLQTWVCATGGPRPRLLPPYREHLSQVFARFFMRVGLPEDLRLPT